MLCVAGHSSKILPIASSKIYPKRLSELKAGVQQPRLFSYPRGFRELGMPETHFPRTALLGSSVNRSSFLCGVAKDPAFLVGGGNNKAGKIASSCWLLGTTDGGGEGNTPRPATSHQGNCYTYNEQDLYYMTLSVPWY